MMRGAITDDQARALCTFLALLRPAHDWDVPGIRAALHKARHKAPADELAIAAIRCAMRDEVNTPALIAEDGPHWAQTVAAGDTRFRRCAEPGHGSYPAHNCGACRSERLATDTTDTTPVLTLSPEQRDVNRRGIRIARAAIKATTREDS